jgi:Trk-type K+ transport system membrane component
MLATALIILGAVSFVGMLGGAVWLAKQRDPSNLWPGVVAMISWLLMAIVAAVLDLQGVFLS